MVRLRVFHAADWSRPKAHPRPRFLFLEIKGHLGSRENSPRKFTNKAYLCCYYLISHCWPLLLAIELMYVSERKGT